MCLYFSFITLGWFTSPFSFSWVYSRYPSVPVLWCLMSPPLTTRSVICSGYIILPLVLFCSFESDFIAPSVLICANNLSVIEVKSIKSLHYSKMVFIYKQKSKMAAIKACFNSTVLAKILYNKFNKFNLNQSVCILLVHLKSIW